MKKLSIVIPLYNKINTIEHTINSIFANISSYDEIIIIDDCSTDGSYEFIKFKYSDDPRFIIKQTPCNSGGPAVPRNIGIRLSTGQYLAFCDGDDLWIKNKIDQQLLYIDKYDFVCTAAIDFVDNINIFNFNYDIIKTKLLNPVDFYFKNPVVCSSVMVNRRNIKTIKFNESSSYIAVEDYDYWLRSASQGKSFLYIKSPLVGYRKIVGQISRNKFVMAKRVFGLYKAFWGNSRALIHIVGWAINGTIRSLIKHK